MGPTYLHGWDLMRRLVELGVIPPHTRRVIIDAHCQDVVKIYVEHVDASPLLRLEAHDIADARVIVTGAEDRP